MVISVAAPLRGRAARGTIFAMGEQVRQRIVVELASGEPISGSLAADGEPEVPFVGLMQLVAALEAVRLGAANPPEAATAVPADRG